MGRVLVVDDEPGLRGTLEVILRRDGHQVVLAGSGEEALAAVSGNPGLELVLSDLRMDGLDGLALLSRLRKDHRDLFVIIMTAFSDWTTAVEAMRLGAYSFLRKPFDNVQVRSVCARALHARDRYLAADHAGDRTAGIGIIGSSKAVQDVQRLVEQVSTTDSTVLITGESGSGKELVARSIHYSSLRADGPMVRVNSAALTPSLLESELFGHVKGAFTGAIENRPGLFTLANAGTLFLDEIGELAVETQAKLLRVLETGEYTPVGSHETKHCDVRVVAATNRDLQAMVKVGSFREDLYYRLAVIPIPLSPLRERIEDIPLLAGNLLARHAVKLRRGITGFSPDAIAALMAYPWPGNVRELDNRIQRGVALAGSGEIAVEHLFGDLGTVPGHRPAGPANTLVTRLAEGGTINLESEVQAHERTLVQAALDASDGNLTAAAERLGLSFRQIRYKVRQLGLR